MADERKREEKERRLERQKRDREFTLQRRKMKKDEENRERQKKIALLKSKQGPFNDWVTK